MSPLGVQVSLLASLSNITDMVIASLLYWSNLKIPMFKRVLILFIDKLPAALYWSNLKIPMFKRVLILFINKLPTAWYRPHETT